MTQRLLVKLHVLNRYTMKRLARYEKMESQRLGKVNLSALVKAPLLLDLKLDSEFDDSSHYQEMWGNVSSLDWSKSVSATQQSRKKHILRPSSAPNKLKSKPSVQKGKLQSSDGGFVVLKLNQKLKSLRVTKEVQKGPERISDDESKTLGHPDTTHHHSPAAARRRPGQKTVAAETAVISGERTDQSSIHGEISDQDAQQLKKDNKDRFCINGHPLPYDPNTREDTLLENILMTEKAAFTNSIADSKDTLKEKKNFIPLSIEDEIEKPNAKIIRADLPKAKPSTPMKMSETYPVLCNDEEYLKKFIFDKYVNLYEDTAFGDTSVVFIQANPVLQNNYNETLAILRSQNFASRVTAKKKKKPTLFSKHKLLSAGILSREVKSCNPIYSQTQKPAGQKRSKIFTMKGVNEINVSQPIHKGTTHELLVSGVNLNVDLCNETGSPGGISGTKHQVLATPVEEVRKRRVVFVDYVPISKPVKMYTYGNELLCYDPSLLDNNFSAINDCIEGKEIRGERSDISQDASDKKAFLDKTSVNRVAFSGSLHHQPSFEGDSEISSSAISILSSRCFQAELNTSVKSLEGEEPPITFSHASVISIPTAQCDASECSRDLPKTTDQ